MESEEATHHQPDSHQEDGLEAAVEAAPAPTPPNDGDRIFNRQDQAPTTEYFTEHEGTSPEARSGDLVKIDSTSWHAFFREMHQDDNHPSGGKEIERLAATLVGISKSKINSKDASGKTALHIAAERGLKRAGIKLLRAGARVGLQDKEKNTPLHYASSSGNVWFANELLNQGALIGVPGADGETPLLVACRCGHAELVEMLLGRSAKTRVFDSNGGSPLHAAALNGHVGAVKHILDNDPTLLDEVKADSGWTALHGAAYKNHGEVVEMLLEAGSRLDIRDNDGGTPLMTAVTRKHESIVEKLLRRRLGHQDLQLETRDLLDFTPLGVASMQGFVAGARLLIVAGADCMAKSSDNATPALVSVCSWRHREIAYAMLTESKQSIDGNVQDGDGWGALNIASYQGNTKIVELLLDHQEAISLSEATKSAALLDGINGGCESVVKLLLGPKGKVPVNTADLNGKTALHYACDAASGHIPNDHMGPDDLTEAEKRNPEFQNGRYEAVLRLLLEQGAEVGARTQTQETALHLAARDGHDDRLIILLQYMEDADISAQNDDGETALCLAFKEKKEGIIRALLTSTKLQTAEFGSDEAERDALSWAAVNSARHDIARLLMVKSPKKRDNPTPANSELWSAIEWAAFQTLPRVLWLLIASSSRSKKTSDALRGATEIAMRINSLSGLSTEQSLRPTPRTASNDDKGEVEGLKAATDTDTGYHGKPDREHQLLMDILRDPPIKLLYSDSGTYDHPQPKEGLTDVLASFNSTVVQFYHDRNESSVIRRVRTVEEMIYQSGPKKIMDETMQSLRDIIGTAGVVPKLMHIDTKPKFSWVHLPSTNMVWMNDLLQRIMKDEEHDADQFGKARSFFQDSWVEIPDRTSPSRIIRPQVVVKGLETEETLKIEREGKGENEKKNEKPAQVHESVDGDQNRPKQEEGRKNHTKPAHGDEVKVQPFIPASALYMPYLSFSVHCPEPGDCGNASEESDGASQEAKLKELREAKEKFDGLLNAYEGSVIHGSPTLDEWYYHFAEDKPSMDDKICRNRTQVVTKSLGNDVRKLTHWPVVRVNQLWVWTIDNKWLVTAAPYPVEGGEDTLLEGIFDYLGKKAEAEGSRAQPRSIAEMTRFIIDYCIGSYERRSETESQLSIRQIFSNSINTIGRDETTLFEDFRARTRKWREQMQRTSGAKASPVTEIREAIRKAEELYCDIKDIRDELNILKSAARYQKAIQDGLADDRSAKADLTASYVVNDLREMDNVAYRIQTAVNTTLSLQQSESANLQAALSVEQGQQAAKQGRTLMVFTVVTILFLPMSFLSSLFAMDIESFQKSPPWAFGVIFGVFGGVFLLFALYRIYSDEVRNFVAKIDKKGDTQEPGAGPQPRKGHGSTPSHKEREGKRSLGDRTKKYHGEILSHRPSHPGRPDVSVVDEAEKNSRVLFTMRSRLQRVHDEENGG